MRIRLDSVVNWALLVTCVTLLTLAGYNFVSGSKPEATSMPPPPYADGERMQLLDDLDYQSGGTTVLLFVNSACRYCTEGMPFYRRLLDARSASASPFRVVVVSPEPAQTAAEYVQAHGLAPDLILRASGERSRVRRTPTLIVVGRDGRVVGTWMGLLKPHQEREVMRRLASGAG